MRAEALALALVALAACASAPPPPPPPDPKPDPLHAAWPKGSPIGASARPFHVKNLRGTATLDIVPGKVNVVAFWATWSSPDIYMLRKLEPIWKRHQDRGLVIAALSIDDEEKGVLETAQQQGATYDIGWDQGHETTSRYLPDTDPSLYIVDRKGVIRFVHRGYHDGEDMEIEKQIESLL